MTRRFVSSFLILLIVFQLITTSLAQSRQRGREADNSFAEDTIMAMAGAAYIEFFFNENGSGYYEAGRVGIQSIPNACGDTFSPTTSLPGLRMEDYEYTTREGCFGGARFYFPNVAALENAFRQDDAQPGPYGMQKPKNPYVSKNGDAITVRVPSSDLSKDMGGNLPLPIVFKISLPFIDTYTAGGSARSATSVLWATTRPQYLKGFAISGRLGRYTGDDEGADVEEVAETLAIANAQKFGTAIRAFGLVYDVLSLYGFRSGIRLALVPVVRRASTSLPRLVTTHLGIPNSTVKSVWDLPWSKRGLEIEKMLGGHLPAGFKRIDKFGFDTGTATSIKSIDLRAASYQSEKVLTNKIVNHLNKLNGFDGGVRGTVKIVKGQTNKRILELAIPPQPMTTAQQAALMNAQKHADDIGVQLILKVIP
jgi:hypothetical protein